MQPEINTEKSCVYLSERKIWIKRDVDCPTFPNWEHGNKCEIMVYIRYKMLNVTFFFQTTTIQEIG